MSRDHDQPLAWEEADRHYLALSMDERRCATIAAALA